MPHTEWMRVTSSAASSPSSGSRLGKTAGEHRLARAGRAREKQVVTAGRGDLERAPGAFLAADIREIGNAGEHLEVVLGRRRLRRLVLAAEIRDRLAEMPHSDRLDARERDLRRRLAGTDETRQPGPPGTLGRDQRAGHGPQAAVETELAERRMSGEALDRHLVRGGEQRECDREIEARALLAEGRRRKVDRDPRARPAQLGRGDAGADARLRLLARAIRQADDGERRHAVLDVRLDLDPAWIDSDQRVGDGSCEHVVTLGDDLARPCAAFVPIRPQLAQPRDATRGSPSGPRRPDGEQVTRVVPVGDYP